MSEVGDAIRELAHVVRTEEDIEGIALQVDDMWNRVQAHREATPAIATDTTSEVARVLREHYPDVTSYDAGDLQGCMGCDWAVSTGTWESGKSERDWEAFHAHQAAILTEAGLLDDAARPEGIERWEVALALTPYMDTQTRYRATGDVWALITRMTLAQEAQIATQEPAGEPGPLVSGGERDA